MIILLLLDEPTAGLSPKASSELLEALHKACTEDGFSYIMVEHNIKVVQPRISSLAVMKQGYVVDKEDDTSLLLNHDWLAEHYF